jgi:hypothetical protein
MMPLLAAARILVRISIFSSGVFSSQRDRFILLLARETSLSTSQETGAIRLYQGHPVFSEWQFRHELLRVRKTGKGTAAF